jgi:menaquinone-dependent protoporphyrinogen oxidase
MPASVLVAYATRYGSTREVAEAVAATLREHGLAVDIGPMRQVSSLDPYRAVVLGAPLYLSHWHNDALHFLARQRAALVARPVAVFALGPFHDDEREYQTAREQLDQDLGKFPWLTPRAITIFGGKVDPANLTFPLNLIPALKHLPASDARNWTAIGAWASELAPQFESAQAVVSEPASEGEVPGDVP